MLSLSLPEFSISFSHVDGWYFFTTATWEASCNFFRYFLPNWQPHLSFLDLRLVLSFPCTPSSISFSVISSASDSTGRLSSAILEIVVSLAIFTEDFRTLSFQVPEGPSWFIYVVPKYSIHVGSGSSYVATFQE